MRLITAIITPATGHLLADPDDLRSDLGIDVSDQDQRLQSLLLDASGELESECGRVFGVQTIKDTYRRDTSSSFVSEDDGLVLSSYPVASITSVVEDGGAALDSSLYESQADAGVLYRLADGIRSSWNSDNIVVTYTAGYILPGTEGANLPRDLQMACRSLAKSAWFSSSRDPNVRQIMVQDVGSESYWVGNPNGDDGYPPEIQRVIDRYRAVRI